MSYHRMGHLAAVLLVIKIVSLNATENGDYTFGNLKVTSEDDGSPSLDTGLYLLSQDVPYDGRLRALNWCGFVVDSNAREQNENVITMFFFLVAFRQSDNDYKQLFEPFPVASGISGNETFGCNEHVLENSDDFHLLRGDRIGVFIQRSSCVRFANNFACPAHVNINDPHAEDCSQVFYFPDTATLPGTDFPSPSSLNNGNPGNVFINMDVVIDPDNQLPFDANTTSPSCASVSNDPTQTIGNESSSDHLLGLIALSGIAIIGAVLSAIIGVASYHYCKRTAKGASMTVTDDATCSHPLDDAHSYAMPADTILEDTRNGGRKKYHPQISTENEYSIVRIGSTYTAVNNAKEAPRDNADHSYETSDNWLEGDLDSEYDYTNEDEYWEPADQETQLKEQLVQVLNVREISMDDIEIQKELGSGQFANVYRGLWKERDGAVREVAIKTLKGEATDEKKVQFLREAATMGQFEHPNILQILAFAYSDDMKPTIIVDLMIVGDLHHHLLTLRPKKGTVASDKLSPTLLSYSRQIAFGMLYLGCKKFIHCDLAARNVLVANDGTCKIADFGLSRNLHREDYYISHGGKVPVKWTAPEALHYRKYSTASDVWSYGCLLYEIWSLGYKPFHKLSNVEALRTIEKGYRLPPPPGCPKDIYALMIKCWNPDTKQRPPFLKIVVALQRPDFQTLQWSQQDAIEYSDSAKSLGAPLENGECLYKTLQRHYMGSVRETLPQSV